MIKNAQRCPGVLNLMGNISKVPERAPEPVQTCYSEGIARPKDLEGEVKFFPPIAFRTANLFFEDDVTAIALKSALLNGKVLILG